MSADKALAVFRVWQEHVLYLMNKTPVCSWEIFLLSAAGGQRELQSPEGSGFEWFECWSRRVEV